MQVVGKLTEFTTKISKANAATDNATNNSPMKLSKNYREELRNVCVS